MSKLLITIANDKITGVYSDTEQEVEIINYDKQTFTSEELDKLHKAKQKEYPCILVTPDSFVK